MTDSAASRLRALPSVDLLLQSERAALLVAQYGRPLATEAIRASLSKQREEAKSGSGNSAGPETILQNAQQILEAWTRLTLVPLINATGVVLHTNLGRAPLSRAALSAVQAVSLGYSSLEYDLAKGGRGSRLAHAEAFLKRLTGAEAALVVNNNAAALLLALTALAKRRRVIIARSQLIEIGGGFRIPEVMSQSGAKLVEVGTTNRVHPRDYEEALHDAPAGSALIMRAHHSNFKIVGFATEPALDELVALAKPFGAVVIDDLGSGVFLDTARYGLVHEPTVQESVAAGADLVCFSGDKLLGGPQAGIIVGRADLVAKLKKHPLARAVRADKLCLAALSETLRHYLRDEAEREIPIWKMIAAPKEALFERASAWAACLGQGEVIAGQSTVGGGSLPEETLPTWLLALHVPQPNRFLARLRACAPPVIARVEEDRVVFDPRTVLPEQEEAFLHNIRSVLGV